MDEHTLRKDNPTIGIALMMLSTGFVVGTGIISRLLVEEGLHPFETVFYRNVIGFIIVLLYIISTKKYELCKSKRPKSQIARAIIGNIAVACSFFAYSKLPVATTSSILLTSPLFVTALSVPLLKEKVGWIRAICVCCGLGGALIITQPGTESFSSAHIVAILGAVAAGSVTLLLRDLSKDDTATTTILWMYGIGILFIGMIMPFVWTGMPHANILFFSVAIISLISQIFKTAAPKFAEASVVSPFKYFNIVWAALFGWVIWAEIPETHVYIGCAIIIASNIVIIWRERKRKRSNQEKTVIP